MSIVQFEITILQFEITICSCSVSTVAVLASLWPVGALPPPPPSLSWQDTAQPITAIFMGGRGLLF